MKKCKGCLYKNENGSYDILDYIDARKKVYIPTYCRLLKEHQQFKKLRERLINGENLLIIEVDGPKKRSLDHYKKTYSVDDSFIDRDTMLCTPDNIKIMLNDKTEKFGHGYCLAIALLDLTL